MPLNRRGSVSARLSVWFSRCSRSRNAGRSAAATSSPPRSNAARALAPCTTCSEARFLVPASVNASVPLAKSNSARVMRAGGRSPRPSQRRRPAIIRCNTRKYSPSSASTMRLPRRRTATTRRPSTLASGGTAVRSTNGLIRRTRSSRLPDDAPLEALDIDVDVGQFRHARVAVAAIPIPVRPRTRRRRAATRGASACPARAAGLRR